MGIPRARYAHRIEAHACESSDICLVDRHAPVAFLAGTLHSVADVDAGIHIGGDLLCGAAAECGHSAGWLAHRDVCEAILADSEHDHSFTLLARVIGSIGEFQLAVYKRTSAGNRNPFGQICGGSPRGHILKGQRAAVRVKVALRIDAAYFHKIAGHLRHGYSGRLLACNDGDFCRAGIACDIRLGGELNGIYARSEVFHLPYL